MGTLKAIGSNEELPKRRGRQAGAKSYNQQTHYKLIVEYKPSVLEKHFSIKCAIR